MRRGVHDQVLLVLGLLAFASSARADKLIGVETAPDEAADAGAGEAPEATVTKSSGATATKRASAGPVGRAAAPSAGDFSFSGSLGANNKGVFGGAATVGYAINRYLGADASYAYHQVQGQEKSGVQYGPGLDLIGRLPNPTIVTPFVGVGVGYLKWQRTYQDEPFDAGDAATASAFGGANLNLTRHFGLQLERRQTVFAKDPPKRFDDMSTREPKSRIATNVGFYMKF